MGDIWVHVRMKECCRQTLADLDKRKTKAKIKGGVLGVKSLAAILGEKTIDEALAALAAGGSGVGGELERLTRAACALVCEKHAKLHHGKGETEEGAFWKHMEAACAGRALPPRAMPGTTPGSHGVHKGRLYVAYADGLKVGGSRAWRNNNPGNIVAGAFAKAHGAIGSDGHFAIFPDEATGHAALTSLLKGEGYAHLTVAEAMAKYAPPSENDTKAYAAAVEKATGLGAGEKMGSLSDAQVESFAAAIKQHEGWKVGDTAAVGAGW
jgi:hypothetical protein